MARIRTIKPGFWTDGKVVSISPYARLIFIGMWNFALCDKGHVTDDALQLKLQILPNDNVDIDELIKELLDAGLVVRIATPHDGRTFLHVKRMGEHQRCDTRWTPTCPVCSIDNATSHDETHASHSDTPASHDETHARNGEKGLGKERKGKEKDMRIDKPMRDIDNEFETWWQYYPLKKAKGQAERAFRAARKLADLDTLTAAVQAYAKITAGQEPRFIAYGSTWLNGKRWLDQDITPITPAAVEDWLRECWTNHDTAAITARCGLEWVAPDIPEHVTDARAYTLQARRDWIKTHHDDILAAILEREANQ